MISLILSLVQAVSLKIGLLSPSVQMIQLFAEQLKYHVLLRELLCFVPKQSDVPNDDSCWYTDSIMKEIKFRAQCVRDL